MGIDYNLARRVTTSGVDSIVLWRGEYQPLARAPSNKTRVSGSGEESNKLWRGRVTTYAKEDKISRRVTTSDEEE